MPIENLKKLLCEKRLFLLPFCELLFGKFFFAKQILLVLFSFFI